MLLVFLALLIELAPRLFNTLLRSLLLLRFLLSPQSKSLWCLLHDREGLILLSILSLLIRLIEGTRLFRSRKAILVVGCLAQKIVLFHLCKANRTRVAVYTLFGGRAILADHVHAFGLHVGRCLVKIVILTSHRGEHLLTLATESYPFFRLRKCLLVDTVFLRLR